MSSATASAVLLVGHGTRSELGQAQFLALAAKVRERLACPLEPAFLELAEPTIEQALARLLARPIDRLIVAPLLLFAAGHAKEDIPAAVRDALKTNGRGEIPLVQTEPYGCDGQMVQLACQRLIESLAGRTPLAAERTLLLAVGRGSSDASATEEMRRFAALLGQRAGISRVQVAFLAVARPSLEKALAEVHATIDRVIVQPHLLFHGDLVERLTRQVGEAAAARPEQEWLVAPLLAGDMLTGGGEPLAALTVSRIEQAVAGLATPATPPLY